MQRFEDREGRSWEVVAGRESWGALVAIFIPVGFEAPLRQTTVPAAGYEEANAWMEVRSEEELRALLAESTEKPR